MRLKPRSTRQGVRVVGVLRGRAWCGERGQGVRHALWGVCRPSSGLVLDRRRDAGVGRGLQRADGGADCARWLRACSAAMRRWRRSCGAWCARAWSWALTTPSARSTTRAPAATATWRVPARARRAARADARVTGLGRRGLPAPLRAGLVALHALKGAGGSGRAPDADGSARRPGPRPRTALPPRVTSCTLSTLQAGRTGCRHW